MFKWPDKGGLFILDIPLLIKSQTNLNVTPQYSLVTQELLPLFLKFIITLVYFIFTSIAAKYSRHLRWLLSWLCKPCSAPQKFFLLTHPLWPMVSPEMPKNLISDFLFLSYWQKFKKMEKIDIFWLIFLFRKL